MALLNNNKLPIGFILDNKYKIVEVLGEGGFGITYKALDMSLNRYCVIKEYLPSFAMRDFNTTKVAVKSHSDMEIFEWGLKSFIEEAQTLAKFTHPNIVSIYSIFKENETAYFVMPFEEGVTLETILKTKKLSEQEIVKISIGILNGLVEVHKKGLIHRDIKPDNIFIKNNGLPILIDFGAAREAIGRKSQDISQIVTPGYAPFEQYGSDGSKQGPWTDIYAFGMTLYRIITNQTKLPSSQDRFSALNNNQPDPLIMPTPVEYSTELICIIQIMTRVESKERPQSVNEVLEFFRKKIIEKQQSAPDETPKNKKTQIPESSNPDLSNYEKKNETPPPQSPQNNKSSIKKMSIGIAIISLIFAVWFFNRKGEIDIYLPQNDLKIYINNKEMKSLKGLNKLSINSGKVDIRIVGDIYKNYTKTLNLDSGEKVILDELKFDIDYNKINTYQKFTKVIIKAIKQKDFKIIEPFFQSARSYKKEKARKHFYYMIKKLEEKSIDISKLKDFKIFFIDSLNTSKIAPNDYYAEISLIAKDENNNLIYFFESEIQHFQHKILIKSMDDSYKIIKPNSRWFEPIKKCLIKNFNNVICMENLAKNHYTVLPQVLSINIDSPKEVYEGYVTLKDKKPDDKIIKQLKEYIIKQNLVTKNISKENLLKFINSSSYVYYTLSKGKIIKYYKVYNSAISKKLNKKVEAKKDILKALED